MFFDFQNILFSATCDMQTMPTNGSVSITTNGSVTMATFTCGVGSSMSGSSVAKCLPDGSWDVIEPICGKTIIINQLLRFLKIGVSR